MGEVATGNRHSYVSPDLTTLSFCDAFPKVATLQKELDELTLASRKSPINTYIF